MDMGLRWQDKTAISFALLGLACFGAACAGSAEVPGGIEANGAVAPAVLPPDPEPDPEPGPEPYDCDADSHEVNDTSNAATGVAYEELYSWGYAYTGQIQGTICSTDEDWFLLPTSNMPYAPGWLSIRLRAAGASHCPAHIEDYDENGNPIYWGYNPPSSPQNTVQIDVYNAATLSLLASASSSIGRIFLDTFNGPLDQDVYIRVHGPAAASYPYLLSARVQDDAWEDECEN